MKRHSRLHDLGILLVACLLLAGCGAAPAKKFYMLNYVPVPPDTRLRPGPYPFTIRLKEFDIEEAYARPQIVYRQSPFELQYYFYRVWAVKPTRMITDLVQKHLLSANLVSSVIRRYDEGAKPEFELSGMIEAIQEYDSEQLWFAHIALRLQMTRIADGKVVYSRRFDNRKRVYQNQPEYVVREMSAIMEYILNQATHDLDVVLAREYGLSEGGAETLPSDADSTTDIPEVWQ
jgi:ABC-type uncharacterized transport system auxiliary subunit